MLAFVYGTLTDPDRVDAVVDEWRFEGRAELRELDRAEGAYPTLVPAGGGVGDGESGDEAAGSAGVPGRLLRTPDVDALDAYEGVDRGLYVRVVVPVVGREEDAAVYVGDPARLGVEASWPGEGSLVERVRRHVHERGVVVVPAGG